MAEMQVQRAGAEHHISGSTVLFATIASLVIDGPLLGMMGFALLATTTLVLVAAPLMLFFSPVIVPAGLVLAASMVGFGVTVSSALVGLSVLMWAFRTVGRVVLGELRSVMEMVRESGERVKEQWMDFGGYLQQKWQAYDPRIWKNWAVAEHHISGTVLYAPIASIVISSPLLGMMGFALLVTATLMLLATPVMLLFSPVIVPAGLVLAASILGFGVAAGTAFVGLSVLMWAFRPMGWMVPGELGRIMGMVRESGERVKVQGMDFGRYLQQKGQAYEPRIWQKRTT